MARTKQTLSLQWPVQKQTLSFHETHKTTRRNIHKVCVHIEKNVFVFFVFLLFLQSASIPIKEI